MEKNSKINVYYGTEENGYEPELIAVCDSEDEARVVVKSNLRTEFDNEDDIERAIADMDSTGYDGFNGKGYVIRYVIGSEEDCLSVLDGMREDFLEEFGE